jgi:hypothetical protein
MGGDCEDGVRRRASPASSGDYMAEGGDSNPMQAIKGGDAKCRRLHSSASSLKETSNDAKPKTALNDPMRPA